MCGGKACFGCYERRCGQFGCRLAFETTVATLVLKEQGYDVTGITLKLLPTNAADKAVADARQAAETLGISHIALDLCDYFEKNDGQPVSKKSDGKYFAG